MKAVLPELRAAAASGDGGRGPDPSGDAAAADDRFAALPLHLYHDIVNRLSYADCLRLAATSHAHRAALRPTLDRRQEAHRRARSSQCPQQIDPNLIVQLRHAYPSARAAGRRRAAHKIHQAASAVGVAGLYAAAYLPLGAVHLGAKLVVAACNAAAARRGSDVRRSALPYAPSYLLGQLRRAPTWQRTHVIARDATRRTQHARDVEARLTKSLLRAVDGGDAVGVRRLLALGARVDLPDVDGRMPLRVARGIADRAPGGREVVAALSHAVDAALRGALAADACERVEELTAIARPGP